MTGDKPRRAGESVERCRRVLAPRSVAVIGASPRIGTLHGRVVPNLVAGGFEGPVHPVNPRYDEIGGLRCFPDVAAIGAPVDLALVLVSADRAVAALDECIAAGIPAAVLFSSGYAEAGKAGRRIQAEVAARTDRLVVAGPNCNGILSQPARAGLGFAPTLELAVADAPRALISHSGAVGTAVATRAASKGLGFRYVIATGNEVDLGVEDYLYYLASEDDPVRSCLLFLETVRDVARFADATAACAERGIRLIALKVGRSERARSVSATHTAALAGPFERYRGLFDRLGIWTVDTLEQLYLCAQFDWWDDRHAGGLAMLAFSGGQAALAADEAERAGLGLAPFDSATVGRLQELTGAAVVTNPFDCSGQIVNDPDRWHGSLAAMTADAGSYGLLALLSVIAGGDDANLLAGLAREADRGANVALAWPSGNSPNSSLAAVTAQCIPLFERVEDAVACLAIRHHSLSLRPPGPEAVQEYLRTLRPDGPPAGGPSLEEVLIGAGLTLPAEHHCSDLEAIETAGRALPGPLVLKATRLLHKSDRGGVVLGLDSPVALRAAAERMAADHGWPLLVQQQISGTREILAGFTRSDLGVAIVIGAGGVLAEVMGDTATLLAPVEPAMVRAAFERLAIGRLLAGYRHLAPADLDRLVAVVAALGRFAIDHPEVASIDLNPIIVSDDGATLWSVDRKVVGRGEEAP